MRVKLLAVAFAVAPLAGVWAQQPTPQTVKQQLDSMVADTTSAMTSMEAAILGLNQSVAQLQKHLAEEKTHSADLSAQLAVVTKDRDDLKAAPKPAEPPK